MFFKIDLINKVSQGYDRNLPILVSTDVLNFQLRNAAFA